jgi:hypothetical protein
MLAPILAVIHVLAAAGWVGAMGYSLLVVQPRAAVFFGSDDEQLEQFVSALARRQRWPVIAALATIAVTGIVLAAIARPRPTPTGWVVAVTIQSVCWAVALVRFTHVSWTLWPARIFALPGERPAWRRRFRRVGLTLLSLAVVASAAGVVATFERQ